MMKEVQLVYQDCPDCGPREKWAAAQYEIAAKNHFQIVKMSFVMPGAKDLMLKAKKSGIRSMPFFTDGKKFSKTLEDFIEKPKAAKKLKKKTKSQIRFEKALEAETSAENDAKKITEVKSDGAEAED